MGKVHDIAGRRPHGIIAKDRAHVGPFDLFYSVIKGNRSSCIPSERGAADRRGVGEGDL